MKITTPDESRDTQSYYRSPEEFDIVEIENFQRDCLPGFKYVCRGGAHGKGATLVFRAQDADLDELLRCARPSPATQRPCFETIEGGRKMVGDGV